MAGLAAGGGVGTPASAGAGAGAGLAASALAGAGRLCPGERTRGAVRGEGARLVAALGDDFDWQTTFKELTRFYAGFDSIFKGAQFNAFCRF